MSSLHEKLEQAIWAGRALFERGKVTGSSANMSFLHEGKLYITGSGTCFGRLCEDSFAVLEGERLLSALRPSKELPLHRLLYKNCPESGAVIHTHSSFITYWSCVLEDAPECVLPSPTPYLAMKVGRLGFVPYEKPGTQALFDAFESRLQAGMRAYVLKNHGLILADDSILNAFYGVEEAEEAAHNAWLLNMNTDRQPSQSAGC